MIAKRTVVKNPEGIHARPASDFVNLAQSYKSRITISNLNRRKSSPMEAKSILAVLSLGIVRDTEVEIKAEGEDETLAVDGLIRFIDNGCVKA